MNFTIVTPNFNMGNYLGETIESVLSNLSPGDEYFIIDGGSTDNSVEVIRKYESKITGWVSEDDNGYADALSKGFSKSKANYQCWINSGDLFLKGAVAEARRILNDTDEDMIFGDDLYIDENGLVIQVSNGKITNLADMMLYGGLSPLQDACFWRRKFYERIGGIDVNKKHAADFDLFLRMSLNGSCQYMPIVFSAFRRHSEQKSQLEAIAYKKERILCQKSQLELQKNRRILELSKMIYYWPVARLRARLASKLSNHDELIGRSFTEIDCQYS